MKALDAEVVVIGAGVVGSAIAKELSGYRLSVLMVEARPDIGDATSKANTAILHTGFDASPGSLESRLVARGYGLLRDYAGRVGIPIEDTGALLVAWDDEQLSVLPKLQAKAKANGYDATQIVDADAVYARVPALGPGALGGLLVPGESIICPWTTNLAYATEAVRAGVQLRRNWPVERIEVNDQVTTVHGPAGDMTCRWVINAAGLGADRIDAMFGYERFAIVPRKGELLVFDKSARALAPVIVLPVPSAKGKGVLISPTIFGNVMLGPTSQNITDRTDTATTVDGIEFLRRKGMSLMPELMMEEVTAMYAGLRASTQHDDFIIEADVAQRYVVAGGIRSTGLTASLAIAEHIMVLLNEAGLRLRARQDLPGPMRMPNLGEGFMRPYRDEQRIAADARYGDIVCFCERVSLGEIHDAFASDIPPVDLDGLRRRTRAVMGRCQGFYCGARVQQLLDQCAEERP